MSVGDNPYNHFETEGDSSPAGPVGGIPPIEKKISDLETKVDHLNRINIDLLLTDMLELADELGRLQIGLNSICTPADLAEIANLRRYRGPAETMERINLMYLDAGVHARTGESSIDAIKNLMNRFQEKVRDLEYRLSREGVL